jgi:hypothetical protein
MGFFIGGHDEESDSLFGAPPSPNDMTAENGWVGGDPSLIPPPANSPQWDPRQWGGRGNEAVNGWAQFGSSDADRDVNRYRQLGAETQAPVQLDDTQQLQSRGLQMGALQRLQLAAKGGAPSRAAALNANANADAIRAATAGVAGARGPANSIVATRNAMGAEASKLGANNQSAMDMRAQETARDQAAYSNGAQGIRGQDIQGATTNAQLVAQQRALEQQKQQAYEKMAWDTRNAQLQAGLESRAQDQGAALALRQKRDAEEAADMGKIKDVASLGVGAVLGVLSDERTKKNIHPIGGLSRLFPRR